MADKTYSSVKYKVEKRIKKRHSRVQIIGEMHMECTGKKVGLASSDKFYREAEK